MNTPWFARIGIIYIPKNLFGWLTLLFAVIYAVVKFIDIDSRSHSVSDTLMNFAFYCILILLVYTLIGFLSTTKKK
jgi:hypothetical protein